MFDVSPLLLIWGDSSHDRQSHTWLKWNGPLRNQQQDRNLRVHENEAPNSHKSIHPREPSRGILSFAFWINPAFLLAASHSHAVIFEVEFKTFFLNANHCHYLPNPRSFLALSTFCILTLYSSCTVGVFPQNLLERVLCLTLTAWCLWWVCYLKLFF